ncbi:MAG: serine/threonine-protein kinase [Myxococcota bacterium]
MVDDQQRASELVGQVVADRYRVVREIGGGGMGFVFEVEHIALGRPFALKILQLGQWNEELVQRFQREARALAKVRSPRVAQVTDFGVASALGPYYVMELVDGESLSARLKRGPITSDAALPLAIDLCEALADVHDVGIVHRDLKPGNIGLPSSGPVTVKLLDFGLAASIDDAFLTRITQSHQVLGSLPYIAPEQFSGARPQVPQDLWALGIVLFQMVAGRLPFDAPSTPALMHAILTAPVPPVAEMPGPLAEVIRQLLHKNPQQRLPSARDAAQAIRNLTPSRVSDVPATRAMPSAPPPPAETLPSTPPFARGLPEMPAVPPPPKAPSIPRTSYVPQSEYPSAVAPVLPSTPPPASLPELPRPGLKTHWTLWLVVGLLLGGLTAVGIVLLLDRGSVNPPPAHLTSPLDGGNDARE